MKMNKTTTLIIAVIVALFVLPKILGGLFNLIGIAITIGLLFVLFSPNLRKRVQQMWKIYNRTKRK